MRRLVYITKKSLQLIYIFKIDMKFQFLKIQSLACLEVRIYGSIIYVSFFWISAI